jgi:hypothetical protein
LSHVLDRGAHAVSNGTARSLSQVIDLGVQAVARVAAILSQQEKITSADVQRNFFFNRLYLYSAQRKFFFTGCIYIVVR